MGICIVILAGYERERHLFGIKELSKYGIDCIYVLYDNVHPEFQEITEPNAIYIKDSASPFFKTYVRGCNPRDFVSIIQELSYIYKKESPSEIFIDVTNFTKESYIAAFTFSILFGARLYYVLPEKYEPIDVRIGKIFSELRSDAEIISKFKEVVQIENNSLQNYLNDFFDVIEKKYKEKVKEQYKFREPTSIQVIPLKIKGLVELTPEHEEILKILRERGYVSSIAQLTKALQKSGKNAEAMVGYRLRQMKDWGFIEITGERKKEISLTELGRGYANGLLASQ